MTSDMKLIRNFCIIAHVDHGKSTVADRLLEMTGTIEKRQMREQVLDSLDLERERGITIKLVPVRMKYRAQNGEEYILNLIDTPGHVDFTYEVSRSIAACEGAILIVDASQGVEAQTLANAYMAVDQGLEIVTVVNKIDLPASDPAEAIRQVEDIIGLDAGDALLVSAKEGIGIDELLERITKKISPPDGDRSKPLQALIFDSIYDNYRGVICNIRVENGAIKKGQQIRMMSTQLDYDVEEVGVFSPKMQPCDILEAGEVGYLIANIKTLKDAHVGDTITTSAASAKSALPGYKKVKPVVFCGFYPVERDEYPHLRDSLEKLQLNDSALTFEPETSEALGFGFRCGFLGLLHMDIAQERLRREFDVDLVATAPNVIYELLLNKGEIFEAYRPSDFPDESKIQEVREPYIKVTVFCPSGYVGKVMKLCQDKRGDYKGMSYITPERARVVYDIPLADFILDFHDKLKSITRGYASLDYEHIGFREGKLVKVDILLHGDPIDAFSFICHKDQAYHRSQAVVRKLKELIPRQQFEVILQASIGKRVITRLVIKPMRKDVIAKCYGGDITRKRKLLEKQKEGKKKMKLIGKVGIPQEAFLAFMKLEEDEE